MCQINPISPYNLAEESQAIRELRQQLSDNQPTKRQTSSVIKDPQSEMVRQLMQRISLGQV